MSEATSTPNDYSPTRASARPAAKTLALAAGTLVLAAALRIYDVGGKDVWIDEANGVLMARESLGELLARLRLDSSPPLYYLILHWWMRVFGDSETALRVPSILGGVAMVGCVFVIGRRLFSLETGLIAAVLVATSPTQIFFSQQARMYSLMPVLALLSTYWLWRAIEDDRRRFLVGYTVATLAALYTHNFGLYLLPAHAVVLLWSGALRRRLGTWLVCAACIVVGYLPWLPTFLAQLDNQAHYSWFTPIWRQLGVGMSIANTLVSFAPGTPQPLYTFGTKLDPSWVSVVAFSAIAVLGIVRLFRRLRGGVVLDARMGWLLCFVGIPLGLALAASCVTTPHYVSGRVDQMVFPGFVLLVAVGLTVEPVFLRELLSVGLTVARSVVLRYLLMLGLAVVRPVVLRYLRYLLLAALLAFSANGLRQYYGNQPAKSDQAVARAIAKRARPGDAVLCTSLTRAPLEYYLGRLEAPVRFFSYPPDTAQHLGNLDEVGLLRKPGQLRKAARLVEQRISEQCGPDGRFFLVLAGSPVNKYLYDELVTLGRSTLVEPIGEFRQSGVRVHMQVSLRRF